MLCILQLEIFFFWTTSFIEGQKGNKKQQTAQPKGEAGTKQPQTQPPLPRKRKQRKKTGQIRRRSWRKQRKKTKKENSQVLEADLGRCGRIRRWRTSDLVFVLRIRAPAFASKLLWVETVWRFSWPIANWRDTELEVEERKWEQRLDYMRVTA